MVAMRYGNTFRTFTSVDFCMRTRSGFVCSISVLVVSFLFSSCVVHVYLSHTISPCPFFDWAVSPFPISAIPNYLVPLAAALRVSLVPRLCQP